MVKIITVISIVMMLCACSSVRRSGGSSGRITATDRFLLALPQSGSMTIVGVSGRQNTRNAEIEAAREYAARKAALFHGVYVYSEIRQSAGVGLFNVYVTSDTWLDYDKEFEKYMERLEFDPNRDVLDVDNRVYIRFTYPASPGSINHRISRRPDGRPEWVVHQPTHIGGFIAGVGTSARQFRTYDTFSKSLDAAAVAISSTISTTVENMESMVNHNVVSTTRQVTEGYLVNFMVIETWVDPSTQSVWTLAVAQRGSGSSQALRSEQVGYPVQVEPPDQVGYPVQTEYPDQTEE